METILTFDYRIYFMLWLDLGVVFKAIRPFRFFKK